MTAIRRFLRAASVALLILAAFAAAASASAPATLTYQGRLKESGLPVTGYRTADIQICDSFTGGTCNSSGVQGVSVVNGVFRTTFTVPAGVVLESGSWFVEVHVNGSAFSPREMLTSTAYSVYSSSASALIAAPGSSYVFVSTPASVTAQDAAGYSVILSSGISTPNGVVRAKAFFGDGSGLTGLPSSTDITKVFKTGDTMTGNLNILASTLTLTGANGNIVTAASVTASAFFGDGSHLSGIVASGAVLKTGDTMNGNLAINNSTLTVNGPIFSTGVFGGAAFSGAGTRFMWVPSSAAVRAGSVNAAQWDAGNIGAFSTAFGSNNTANANYSAVGGGAGNAANGAYGVVAGGQNNSATFAAAVGGGNANAAGALYSAIPGGSGNTVGAGGQYSLAAGDQATANGQGEFVWADTQGTPLVGVLRDQFLVRAMGGFDIQSSSFIFTNGVSTFVYVDNTGLAMAAGSSITLSGSNGVIVTQSSITAGTYFGDGHNLTGVTASGAVQKTGDTMSGNLSVNNSTLTVNGPLISTGTTGGVVFSGAGTRFMWVPSLGAIRAGAAISGEWDVASIGNNSVAFGQNNKASGNQSVVSGGISNIASGLYSVVPGGYLNTATGAYSFAAGAQASALQQGSFVWADAMFTNLISNISNQFLVRSMGGFDIQSSSFIFTNGVSTFVYVDAGGMTLLSGSSITLSGPGGNILSASSVTASSFFGDGSHLTGLSGAGVVQRAGDTMTGNLSINNSTITVNGPIFSTGTSGGTAFAGAGTRFMWIPSSAAVRGGSVTGALWDSTQIGGHSVAFGEDNKASSAWSVVAGGAGNSVSGLGIYGVIAGGDVNVVSGIAGAVGGGLSNQATGGYATVPGGTANIAAGQYSFAAGAVAQAMAQGSFVWADSAGGGGSVLTNNIADSFLARAMGGFTIFSSSFNFGNGVSTFVYVNNTGLAMATGSSITLSGANGVIVTQSSITAGTYYGDGHNLTGVIAAGNVVKTGDVMSGNLAINNSTITVNGPIFSTGTSGGTAFAGAGTRFMWIPSSAAVRGGSVNGPLWDGSQIGGHSVAFGEDNAASGSWSVIGGGGINSVTGSYGTIAGGLGNTLGGNYGAVGGGNTNNNGGASATIGGGLSNTIGGSGSYATIPGGSGNQANNPFSFAAGFKATANAQGAFVWADSAGGIGVPITNNVADSFLVRALGGFDVISSTYYFTNGISTFVYIDHAGIVMTSGSSITLSGAAGTVTSQSSVTASAFYGDGSHLTGVAALGAVQKTGDTMSGSLFLNSSTLTVSGAIVSTGSYGGAGYSGLGTRFMWIPSSAAFRAGGVTGSAWDPLDIGAYSAAFGQDNQANGDWSSVGGGSGNSISANALYNVVGGGYSNLITGGGADYDVIGGGKNNSITGRSQATIAGGQSNLINNTGDNAAIGGGYNNKAYGTFSTVPGGYLNYASANYTFAAGTNANVFGAGSFVWSDSGGNTVAVNNYIQDQFLVRAQGGFDVISSSFIFSNTVSTLVYIRNDGDVGIGTTNPGALLDVNGIVQFGTTGKSSFTATGALNIASGVGITVSGANGLIIAGSSVIASAFYGNGAGLTGVISTGAVSKAGDAMTGQLTLMGSTLTVGGSAFSVGGSTFMVVAASVGVGAIDPNFRLNVAGSVGASGGLSTDGNVPQVATVKTQQLWLDNIAAMGYTGTGGLGIIWGDGGGAGGQWAHQDFYVSTQLTPMLRINSFGVGVGGAGPLNRLDVAGGGIAVGSYAGLAGANLGSAILSGTVSIGTSTQNDSLDVYASPQLGTAESVAKFSVSDADAGQYLQIANNTIVNGEFDPKISAHVTGTNAAPLVMEANSGSNDSVGGDSFVLNALLGSGSVVNRTLFNLQNNGAQKFVVTAGGGVGIGALPPGPGSLQVSPPNTGSVHGIVIEKSGGSSNAGLEFKDSAFTRTWQFGGNLGNFSDGRMQIYDETGSAYRQVFFGNGDIALGSVGAADAQSTTPAMYLLASGKIGLGTNSPVYDLDFGKIQHTIGVEDQSTANVPGSTLTIRSGSGGPAGTGAPGGPLILQSGNGAGATASGGPIVLSAGISGTTGVGGSIVLLPGTGTNVGSVQIGDPNTYAHLKSVQVAGGMGTSFLACGGLNTPTITLTSNSNDMSGIVTISYPSGGTAGTANCTMTITFAKPYSNNASSPLKVLISPMDANAQGLSAFAAAAAPPNSNNFTFTFKAVPVQSTSYSFSYFIME
jgi:hypothetical protein